MEKVLVTDRIRAPGTTVGGVVAVGATQMLRVIGSVNFAPAAVTQLSPVQVPVWHAHELRVTTTVPASAARVRVT
jgi:hypothetical protein